MAKGKSPYLNEIHGGLRTLGIRTRRNGVIEISTENGKRYTRTEGQDTVRTAYALLVAQWRAMTAGQKAAYNAAGAAHGLSGWNMFVKENLHEAAYPSSYTVSISNPAAALSNFQVMLQVTNDADFFTFYANNAWIECYTADGITPIPFYIEQWDTENHNAKIWLKMPVIAANAVTTAIIKKNTKRTESLSSQASVWDLWDDFNGTLSWRTVRVGGTGYVKAEDGYLKVKSTSWVTAADAAVTLQNSCIDLSVKVVDQNEGFTIGMTDGTYNSNGEAYNDYEVQLNSHAITPRINRLVKMVNKSLTPIAQSSSLFINNGNTYAIQHVWLGNNHKTYINGTQLWSSNDSTYSSRSYLCLGTWGTSEYWVDWIRVRKVCSQTLTITYGK